MKILVAGDLHGSPMAAQKLVYTARAVEADEIWQAGDFGYWPNEPGYEAFIEIMREAPTGVYFADGNHEDHRALASGTGRLRPRQILDNIWHQPRGSVREVGGKRVMFFGGAQSVDEAHRMVGVSWFREELPNATEWANALEQGKVDVVVAHEAPPAVNFHYPPHHQAFWPTVTLQRAERFRIQLEQHLLPSADPGVWFHGHHHKAKHTRGRNGIRDFYSLNCDGHKGTFATYDTETGETRFVHVRGRDRKIEYGLE